MTDEQRARALAEKHIPARIHRSLAQEEQDHLYRDILQAFKEVRSDTDHDGIERRIASSDSDNDAE